MKADFSDVMANSSSLLDKAEIALRQRLSKNKDDEDILWQLAVILRQRGKIDDALDCCQRLLILKPNHPQAKLLSAIFREQPVNNLYSDKVQLAAYARVDDFLAQEQLQKIWEIIKQKKNKFSISTIIKGTDIIGIESSYRNAHILFENDLNEISGWFLEKNILSTFRNLAQATLRAFCASTR